MGVMVRNKVAHFYGPRCTSVIRVQTRRFSLQPEMKTKL